MTAPAKMGLFLKLILTLTAALKMSSTKDNILLPEEQRGRDKVQAQVQAQSQGHFQAQAQADLKIKSPLRLGRQSWKPTPEIRLTAGTSGQSDSPWQSCTSLP